MPQTSCTRAARHRQGLVAVVDGLGGVPEEGGEPVERFGRVGDDAAGAQIVERLLE